MARTQCTAGSLVIKCHEATREEMLGYILYSDLQGITDLFKRLLNVTIELLAACSLVQ